MGPQNEVDVWTTLCTEGTKTEEERTKIIILPETTVQNSHLHDTNLSVHYALKRWPRRQRQMKSVRSRNNRRTERQASGERSTQPKRQILKFTTKFARCHAQHCLNGTPDSLWFHRRHCDVMNTSKHVEKDSLTTSNVNLLQPLTLFLSLTLSLSSSLSLFLFLSL